MNDDRILIERTGAVATVTVNRPKVLNALNAETVAALTAVFVDLRTDDEIRAVVLTGAGDRAFIAGADIGELARLTPQTARALTDAGHRMCDLIEGLGKPVIAINAAIVWHAYRANGFEDRIYGCGSLLSDH